MTASGLIFPESTMLSLNSAPFKKKACVCAHTQACTRAHTHTPLAEKHWQFPKKQFAAVTPGQVFPHCKAQQLKHVREAALLFGDRIINLCLQFTNPIIAMYLDHYSCVIKIG